MLRAVHAGIQPSVSHHRLPFCVLPSWQRALSPSHHSHCAELKQALAAAGIASEFHAGSLYCAGHVVVRRRQPAGGGGDGEEGGGLLVEGALSEEYYRIREVVYAQYHIC